MKKNIFLDFLSPDNWKTYATVPKNPMVLANYTDSLVSCIKQSINIAILLTSKYCLLPPAFIIQSPIAFRAVFESALYLDEKLIYLPLRETSIDQYIGKKITEYVRVRNSHTGFYNEEHWDFLSRYQELLIHRNSPMGMTIAKQWLILPDTADIWKPIINYSERTAEKLRPIPMKLKERGESVTLEAILGESKSFDSSLARYINQAIQHEYIKAYITEYNASILSNAPPKPFNENYLVPIDSCYYDFRLFTDVLSLLGLKDYFLFAYPELIINFLREPEYETLVNIYFEVCSSCLEAAKVESVYRYLVKKTGKSMTPYQNGLFGIKTFASRFRVNKIVKDRINRVADAFYEFCSKKNNLLNCIRGDEYIMSISKIKFGCDKVFIVHGHDTKVRNEVELFLRRLKFEPIILSNEASKGKTIIEKMEDYSDVAFAIVLYTACDEGRAKGTIPLSDRARQNVIFEHGFFCAKLGRNHVVALHEEGVEIPGDLSGVVYISLLNDWKAELKKEMKAAGLEADWVNG